MNGRIVREALPVDRPGVEAFLAARDSVRVARLGELVDTREHPALVAVSEGRIVGVLTWIDHGDALEALTLHAEPPGQGTGTQLLDGVRRIAETLGRHRIWLVTTNDNTDALRFYQRRGFRLAGLHEGAVDRSRAELKPSIPATGDHGIPLRDELELELATGAARLPAAGVDLEALELALARRNEAAIDGGYDAILAPDFVEYGQSGRRWTRQETLAALTGAARSDVPSFEGFEAVELGPGIVLATYGVVGVVEGSLRRSRHSSTWVRREGRWQLRFHQGTRVPPEGSE